MTVEELLKPRYKVIADYPAASFDVGIILMRHHKIEDWLYCPSIENDFYGLKESCVKRYPHLFRKLEWWEERDEKDMPKYLKETIHQRIVIKISQWVLEENICFISAANAESRHKQLITQLWLPATEQEYIDYINKK